MEAAGGRCQARRKITKLSNTAPGSSTWKSANIKRPRWTIAILIILLLNVLRSANGRPRAIDVAAYAKLHADLPKLIEARTAGHGCGGWYHNYSALHNSIRASAHPRAGDSVASSPDAAGGGFLSRLLGIWGLYGTGGGLAAGGGGSRAAAAAAAAAGEPGQRYAVMVSAESGLADRLTCSLSVLLYALLTGRAFEYVWLGPHDLWAALPSPWVDWRAPPPPALPPRLLDAAAARAAKAGLPALSAHAKRLSAGLGAAKQETSTALLPYLELAGSVSASSSSSSSSSSIGSSSSNSNTTAAAAAGAQRENHHWAAPERSTLVADFYLNGRQHRTDEDAAARLLQTLYGGGNGGAAAATRGVWQRRRRGPDLLSYGWQYDNVVWSLNHGQLWRAAHNPALRQRLQELGLIQPERLAPCLFNFLYVPSPEALAPFARGPLLGILLDPENFVIGIQIRLGDWVFAQNDNNGSSSSSSSSSGSSTSGGGGGRSLSLVWPWEQYHDALSYGDAHFDCARQLYEQVTGGAASPVRAVGRSGTSGGHSSSSGGHGGSRGSGSSSGGGGVRPKLHRGFTLRDHLEGRAGRRHGRHGGGGGGGAIDPAVVAAAARFVEHLRNQAHNTNSSSSSSSGIGGGGGGRRALSGAAAQAAAQGVRSSSHGAWATAATAPSTGRGTGAADGILADGAAGGAASVAAAGLKRRRSRRGLQSETTSAAAAAAAATAATPPPQAQAKAPPPPAAGRALPLDPARVYFLLLSDSTELRQRAAARFGGGGGGGRLLVPQGQPIEHVQDHSRHGQAGLDAAAAELWLFGLASAHVVTEASAFGRLGALAGAGGSRCLLQPHTCGGGGDGGAASGGGGGGAAAPGPGLQHHVYGIRSSAALRTCRYDTPDPMEQVADWWIGVRRRRQ